MVGSSTVPDGLSGRRCWLAARGDEGDKWKNGGAQGGMRSVMFGVYWYTDQWYDPIPEVY